MDILQITDIYKSFGSKKILDGVSFNVSENSIFGFIGKNGAGKTRNFKKRNNKEIKITITIICNSFLIELLMLIC